VQENDVGLDEAFMAHQEPPKPPGPGEGPLDDPAVGISTQLSTILVERPGVVASRRK
jgi:hypothetical protein